jgi:hypothetical protein
MQETNEKTERLVFGFQREWEDFHKRQALFLERFPHLSEALSTAFLRTAHLSEAIDKFVFMYGRLCCEDFSEVLLLCGNGYGHGATKLVRTLYERAVTLRYLHDNPEHLDDFFDFHHVSQHKLMVNIKETMGDIFAEEVSVEVEKRYQELKEKFMVTDCKKCKTKKPNHTWSKLDFVAMAKKTELGKLIGPGYYIPLRQAHSTVASLLSRLEETESGGVGFIPTAQRGPADHALTVAHNIILRVLDVQEERFKVSKLKDQLQVCLQDFLDIHVKPAAALSASQP